MAIKTVKEHEGAWTVWNTVTHASANIIAIQEYGYLASGNKKYRVDVRGTTVASMIGNFQTAKSIATKHIK